MITLLEKTVDVACASNGYFLRWYFNGWHHWLFKAGDENFTTVGDVCNTSSGTKVTIGDGCLTENQIRGIRTMLFASEIQVLMQDGWKAVVVESSTLPIFHTKSPSYNCEFTISIYAKVADYSPIIPVTPAEDLIVSVQSFADIEVEQNSTLTLPTTALCTYASGATANLPIVWGEANTLTVRTFTVVGKIAGAVVDASVKVIVTPVYTDLDILRMIRDANPASQLPTLWLDSEAPYTQWEGVTWNIEKTKVTQLQISNRNISTLDNVKKLAYLTSINCNSNNLMSLDVSGMVNLKTIICGSNQLSSLNISGLYLTTLNCSANQLTLLDMAGVTTLTYLTCDYNQLASIPTLISKGSITTAAFTDNKFNTTEVSRLLSLGFTVAQIGTQNP